MKRFWHAGIAISLLGAVPLAGAAHAQASAVAHQNNLDVDNPPTTSTHVVPGDRVPDEDQQDKYVVTAWESYGLESPPVGYRWLRNDKGGQYLLTSVKTGQVADTVDQASRNTPHDQGVGPDTGVHQTDVLSPGYQWSRGDRLSGSDLDARFVVVDWKGAGLPRPTRGYHWVDINHHYMLTSRQTGVISDIR